MKSLLLHCKEFSASFTGISTRGVDVAPEEVVHTNFTNSNSITAFITVEDFDDIEKIVSKISKEIQNFCKDTNESRVTLCPFAHLSNKLAPFKTGILFFDKLEENLKSETNLEIVRVHFGSDKDLLMHVYGHPGNARFRDF